MSIRKNIIFPDNQYEKYLAIRNYLEGKGGRLQADAHNTSATLMIAVETFYRLFLETDEEETYAERIARLEKNLGEPEDDLLLKSIRRDLDKLFYLELTNFHATTKGAAFDIQDLESIHSKLDPVQNELLARINDVIQEDKTRGQTQKHSH